MSSSNRQITHYFFSSTVGIVRVEDVYDGVMYYVKNVVGMDLKKDILFVANWGNRFPKEAGDALFKNNYMTKAH